MFTIQWEFKFEIVCGGETEGGNALWLGRLEDTTSSIDISK